VLSAARKRLFWVFVNHLKSHFVVPSKTEQGANERGLMLRRPISSAPVLTDLTGEEGNKIIEQLTGEVEEPSEYRTDNGSRADR
jgi:hypothetical protein